MTDRLADLSPDAIWVVDPDGRLVAFNIRFARAFAWLYGIEPHAGTGLDVLPDDDRHRWRDFYARVAHGESFSTECAVEASGERREFEVRFAPGEGGRGAAVVARDVTDVRAALSALVVGFAHEVRNPLFALTATLDALEEKSGSLRDHATQLDVLRGQTDRIVTLTRSLLDYGSRGSPELGVASLAEPLRDAVHACRARAARAGVSVALVTEAELGSSIIDRERMKLAFERIVDNAIAFSPRGGRVSITASRRSHAIAGRTTIECEVRDEGPGFDAAHIARVFEPFFSTRPGAAGLGLAIARSAVTAHGGTIEAFNGSAGAVIRVRLMG